MTKRRKSEKSSKKRNKLISDKIRVLLYEGYERKQAVAIALSMHESGRLRPKGVYIAKSKRKSRKRKSPKNKKHKLVKKSKTSKKSRKRKSSRKSVKKFRMNHFSPRQPSFFDSTDLYIEIQAWIDKLSSDLNKLVKVVFNSSKSRLRQVAEVLENLLEVQERLKTSRTIWEDEDLESPKSININF